jgi:hypothetical protein
MWLPYNEPDRLITGNLKRSHLPDLGYLRVLDEGNESILFIKDEKIVSAWHLDIETLIEYYENKAIELLNIRAETQLEVYEIEPKLFDTITELNEECKLSIPVEVEFIVEKYGTKSPIDRDKLLLKYGIRDPSSNDLETLIKKYKIGE